MQTTIPHIPDNAPFTAEQRAWLNGFFAGLLSIAPKNPTPRDSASKATQPLTILFGSQTGNAEALARRFAKLGGGKGFDPTVIDLGQCDAEKLGKQSTVLIVTSTYGDGEPPDSVKSFWADLSQSTTKLPQVRFAVCALGDSNYPHFCAFGRAVDERLATLGARRLHARIDCDVDFEGPAQEWFGAVVAALSGEAGANSPERDLAPPPVAPTNRMAKPVTASWSRTNPFPARLIANTPLNRRGSAKDTRHIVFSLAESGISYEAGDALGVTPQNCPELVQETMCCLGFAGDEPAGTVTIREAFSGSYELTRISDRLLKVFAERTGSETLLRLTAPGVNGELTRFLKGRDLIDLLAEFPTVRFQPEEILGLLKKLQPRLYSIASSQKATPDEVHLTVGVVRYELRNRQRKGVCSTFMADRLGVGEGAGVFVHHNKNFRLPGDPATPIIMVGPGTGIAPFRGFLHERRAMGATGRNWLFFGDQHRETDFLYQEEIEAMLRDGHLKLDLAFSRDQNEKLYVQHRMRECARELYDWLEQGAQFYVCGDASRMAGDVDAALHTVIETAGEKSVEQAREYVARLRAEKRYQRDVY